MVKNEAVAVILLKEVLMADRLNLFSTEHMEMIRCLLPEKLGSEQMICVVWYFQLEVDDSS